MFDEMSGTTKIIIAFIAAAVLIGGFVYMIMHSRQNDPYAGYIQTSSGLRYKVNQEGSGQIVKSGDVVSVKYTGRLQDGTVFDSSEENGRPFIFTVGQGQVIKGWDEGIVGMKVGELRTLVIPPTLGYGSRSNGPIPANATLIFEVEVTDIIQQSS